MRRLSILAAGLGCLWAAPAFAHAGDAVLALWARSQGEGVSDPDAGDSAEEILDAAVGVFHPVLRLASAGPDGAWAPGWSSYPAISADGRFVAFESNTPDLAGPDANGVRDVFVRDLDAGETLRASVAWDGGDGDGVSHDAAIDAGGRRVAFASIASNLVPGDGNAVGDCFVRDLDAGETLRASVASDGSEGPEPCFLPAISGNGRFVAFATASALDPADGNDDDDVYVRDLLLGEIRRVSVAPGGGDADGRSRAPSLSHDGSRVAFQSEAANLVPFDGNGKVDVFVANLETGEIVRAGVGEGGTEGDGDSIEPSLSADGLRVAFSSKASNLVSRDYNETQDVFVRDLELGRTTRASVSTDGEPADDLCRQPRISADGRRVVFASLSERLVPGDANGTVDVFLRDLEEETTELLSRASDGASAADGSYAPAASADGRFVAFASQASNLLPGDANANTDVFVLDRGTPIP